MGELLRLEDISFYYEEKRMALNHLSVSLYESEKVAIIGNNGAGKSTFFLCCNGVRKFQKGKLFLKGKEIKGTKKERLRLRQTVGLVFQDPDSQIIAGTVEAEISFGPMNLRLLEEVVQKQVNDAVAEMHLEALRTRAPHYLSGGEKKRVSIADILAMNPQLLLFDEPTAGLDPANTKLFEKNIDKLSKKGLGIVIATHDMDFVWRWADRVLVLHNGELAADAKPEEVFSDERLLKTCGLIQPILFQVGKLYHFDHLPKTISDIRMVKYKV